MSLAAREIERARELLGGVMAARREKGPRPPALRLLRGLQLRAGLTPAETRGIALRLLSTAGLLLAALLLTRSLIFVLLLPAYLAVEYYLLSRRAAQRVLDFERDYVPLLLALASGIRTGLDPLVALEECGKLFPESSEVRRETARLQERVARGEQEDQVVRGFAASIAHPDVQLFRTTFVLARREGSSLAGTLQRLARVTRRRQSFRRKMRASLAMQRLSAIGIAGCAAAITVIQTAANPAGVSETLADPLGRRFLGLGCLLIAAGLVWMLHISRRRI